MKHLPYENVEMWGKTQIRMGVWIEQGLPMPIPNINYNYSHLLLCHLTGRGRFDHGKLDDDVLRHLNNMLGPNGYAYYRMLLAQKGEFNLEDEDVMKAHREYKEYINRYGAE